MPFSDSEKKLLLEIARHAIAQGHEKSGRTHPLPECLPESLLKNAASFVTLKKNGELRGCIGSIEAVRPLAEDTAKNAAAAAFHDRRFDPLGRDELAEIRIEISVLYDFQKVRCNDRKELFRMIQPGLHGLIVTSGRKSGTFLPSVWKHLEKPEAFFSELLKKANIPENCDIKNLSIVTYKTETFNDN